MKKRIRASGFSVHAIAGSHVVILGMDADASRRKGLLGFAIRRIDKTENEAYWLRGFRTFRSLFPDPPLGTDVSTHEHPVQDFLWTDFTAKPNHEYTYEILPMSGKPGTLDPYAQLAVTLNTESEFGGKHAVFFNRGVIGSQAYARKFDHTLPGEKPEDLRLRWLSRGLFEAFLSFLDQAKNESFALRAAVYEFKYPPVLEAFKNAWQRCGNVKIIFDAKQGAKKPESESREAIQQAGITEITIPRTANPSFIAHNKFVVMMRDEKPEQVWTGSMNFTRSGIFGHSNVGHIVRDPNVAHAFLDYWERLAQDPKATELRQANDEATPTPEGLPPQGVTPIFSPRGNLGALDYYAQLMDGAHESVFFTAAFGVNPKLAKVLSQDKEQLRFILLEKPGNTFRDLIQDKDTQIAVGSNLRGDFLSRWIQEQENNLSQNVKYVHTKYLLIDALSSDPIVVTGSANFSESSTTKNDENMIVIRGDERVADIYLGEFVRLFKHHKFRAVANRQASKDPKERSRAYLAEDDSWTDRWYQLGSVREKMRLLFA